jgi:GH15 family glucan-1,4-alpha-glucosidase
MPPAATGTDERVASNPASKPIEDYAMIGDLRTAALVGRDGSIDWLCLPRFDSGACFAALLGTPEHGRWRLAPAGAVTRTVRRYRGATLVLETELTCADGVVRIVDCMPPDEAEPHVLRLVEGVSGRVPMHMELVVRFDYGRVVPWVRRAAGGLITAIGGPDALALRTPVHVHGVGLTSVADFTVAAGERVPFALRWYPSHHAPPPPLDVAPAIDETERWWRAWSERCGYAGPWREAVLGSLVVLKALGYAPTGAIVAAATTSLPEALGGVRNWDYRFCWLRDATFTLMALMAGGHREEAEAWRDWLLRAIAGDPAQLQIMYGVGGERRLPELELPWLPGYAGSAPVRIGNAAVHQVQLDVYGEVNDALFQARKLGVPPEPSAWAIQHQLLNYLEGAWREPDEGLWEVRGPRRHFTHSKMMVWVALDRAVKSVERLRLDGPVDRWRALRDEVHAEICARAFDPQLGAFTQYYGSGTLDASLLLAALVGFLPPDDPRVVGTVRAIERDLLDEGLVLRYRSEHGTDGLPPGEGAFLACSFWLADNYALMGRTADARALFERLLALRNDVGLLAEQYDPRARRQVGNFPQAFSHVGLVDTALNLTPEQATPARDRKDS